MQDLLANGVSAALGGGVATLALYPLDALRTKLAAEKGTRSSSFAVLADVIRRHGVLGLFVGVSPKLIQSMLGKFLYFVFFTGLVSRTRALNGGLPVELLCGYLAEAMHLPLTIPLEVVTTRIQKASSSAGIAATLRAIVADSGGIAGLWTGWRAYVFLCTQVSVGLTMPQSHAPRTYWLTLSFFNILTHTQRTANDPIYRLRAPQAALGCLARCQVTQCWRGVFAWRTGTRHCCVLHISLHARANDSASAQARQGRK